MEFIKKYLIKIIIFVVFVSWVSLILIDFFRAKDMKKPLICLSEKSEKKYNGEYYECTSFGYVYFEFAKEDETKDYGFRAIFSPDPIEKEYGNE